MRVQNEGTGKSSWWMINPDAKPGKSVRRRAASMETSKFEKRRGRVKKKVSKPNLLYFQEFKSTKPIKTNDYTCQLASNEHCYVFRAFSSAILFGERSNPSVCGDSLRFPRYHNMARIYFIINSLISMKTTSFKTKVLLKDICQKTWIDSLC